MKQKLDKIKIMNFKQEYIKWLNDEIYPTISLGFHPDSYFEDYVDSEGHQLFTQKECLKLNSKMEYFFKKLGDDVYDIGLEEIKKYHPEYKFGKDFDNLKESKIMNFSEFLNESKKISISLPNTNIELKDYKNDINGNPIISCSFINKSNFTIQTSGTLKETEYILKRQKISELSDKDLIIIEKEIVNYIEKFGSKLQKQNLRKDSNFLNENYCSDWLSNENFYEFYDCMNAIIDEDYTEEDRLKDIINLIKLGNIENLYKKYKTKNITNIAKELINTYANVIDFNESKSVLNKFSNKAKYVLKKLEEKYGKSYLIETDENEISIDFKYSVFPKSKYNSIEISKYNLFEFFYDLEHDGFNLRVETEGSLLPEYVIENSLDYKEIIKTIELVIYE